MADIKAAYSSATSLTITNANLASSATAGWQSAVIDNSSTLYDDILIEVDFAAVNTAPSNSQTIYLFAFGSIDGGTKFTSTGDGVPSGSEGTLTFPNITSLGVVAPFLGVIPYSTQNKELIGGPFSVRAAFGGALPPKFSIGMINYSGMTLNVTSIKWMGRYNTVI